MQYSNLTQRSISYFLNTYADFKPLLNVNVSVEQQKKAFDFIKNLYQKVFDVPEILCAKQLPDDSYGRWQRNKDKPSLDVNIRKTITKMEEIISALFEVCLNGKWEAGKIVV